jgi:hypothetical protein
MTRAVVVSISTAVAVVAGLFASVAFERLDQTSLFKLDAVDDMASRTALWVKSRISNTTSDPGERAWSTFESVLPAEILSNRNAYDLHVLVNPREIRSDDSSRWQLFDLCDFVPEWSLTYSPTQLHVPDGYFAFLSSLEPVIPQLASSSDRNHLQRLLNRLSFAKRQGLDGSRPLERASPQAEGVDDTVASLERILEKYRGDAAKRGMRSVGGADYYSQYWNDAYEEERPSASGGTRVKKCEAEGVFDWLQSGVGRPTVVEGARPGAPRVPVGGGATSGSWQYIDFGDATVIRAVAGESVSEGERAIELQARRIRSFPFRRGGWFNSEAIRLYGRSGPWAKDTPVKNPDSDLWGPKGVLRRLPVAIIVADSPSVVLKAAGNQVDELLRWAQTRKTRASREMEPRQIGAIFEARVLPDPHLAYVVAVVSLKMPFTSRYD